MKKISLMLVMLMAVSSVVSANDIDNPKAPVGMAVMKTGSTFKLFYKGEKSGTVKVTIYNSKHRVVFTETIRKMESFVRPYNFSSLAEGDYSIELESDNNKQVEHIHYTKGKIQSLVNVIQLSSSDNKYVLTVPNKGTQEITVDIYNGTTRIYSQKESITGDFAKIYDLKKVFGNIQFRITDQNGTTKSIDY